MRFVFCLLRQGISRTTDSPGVPPGTIFVVWIPYAAPYAIIGVVTSTPPLNAFKKENDGRTHKEASRTSAPFVTAEAARFTGKVFPYRRNSVTCLRSTQLGKGPQQRWRASIFLQKRLTIWQVSFKNTVYYLYNPQGWPEGIEPSFMVPQTIVLPLNDGHPSAHFVFYVPQTIVLPLNDGHPSESFFSTFGALGWNRTNINGLEVRGSIH